MHNCTWKLLHLLALNLKDLRSRCPKYEVLNFCKMCTADYSQRLKMLKSEIKIKQIYFVGKGMGLVSFLI